MVVLASWSGGAPPTVVGDVTVASPGSAFWGSDHLVVGDTAAAAHARFDVAPTPTLALRYYFTTPAAWASASVNVLAVRATVGSIMLGAAVAGSAVPGQFRVTKTGGGVVQQTPGGALQTSTGYRFELRLDTATGDASYGLYPLGSVVPVWEGSATAVPEWNAPVIRVDVGRVNSSPTLQPWAIGHVVLDSDATQFVGKHAGDVSGGGGEQPSDDFPFLFDGTFADGDEPLLNGGGVGSHGQERLLVRASDPGFWPGPGSLEVNQGEGSTAFAQYTLAPKVNRLHLVVWAVLPAWASAGWAIATLRPSTTSVAATITLSGSGQPGQARLLRDGGLAVSTAPLHTLVAGGLYRFELLYDGPASRARLGVFSAQTATPIWETGWQTHPTFSEQIEFVQLGRVTQAPVVDSFKIGRWYGSGVLPDEGATGSPWLGYDAAVEGLPRDELWDGTQLLPLDPVAQYWNGSSLQPLQG